MALAAFALVPCNVLLLDEASNHLDAATINVSVTCMSLRLWQVEAMLALKVLLSHQSCLNLV